MKTILYLVLLVVAAGYYGSEAQSTQRTTNAEHGWTDDDWTTDYYEGRTTDDNGGWTDDDYVTDDYDGRTTHDYDGWTTHEYKGWVSCGCHDAPSCRQCGSQPHLCNGDCTWNWSGCRRKHGPGPTRPPPHPTGETPVSMGTRPPPTWETPVHISRPPPSGGPRPPPTGESRPPPPSRPSRPPPTGESRPPPSGGSRPPPTGESRPPPTGESRPPPTGPDGTTAEVTTNHSCPKYRCPTASGSNDTNSSLPGTYCEENHQPPCWPNASAIANFSNSINGRNKSCLGLPKLVIREDKHANVQCLNYTGLPNIKNNKYAKTNCSNIDPYTKNASMNEKNQACMTPYQFLTNRNYVKIKWMPAFIVTAESADDITQAIQFAENHGLPVAVMSTGHDDQDRNAGPGDNSILIRTTCFTNFTSFTEGNPAIESANGITWNDGYAEVGAGLTFGPNYWEDVENSEGLYELARRVNREIVGGTCNSVGVVGWTLGGGRGWTAPKYGLGVDQLLHVDMVGTNGKHISANFRENSDLFYAIRGGGGGFGVIYSIKIKLHISPCGSSNWTGCYTAKALYIADKYSDTSKDIVGNVTQAYMNWSIIHGKNKWNSILQFKYECTSKNYTIWIGANCLEKTSNTTCKEFDDLNKIIRQLVTDEKMLYIESKSQNTSNYWTFYDYMTGEISVNGRWEQQLRSLVDSSAADDNFIDFITTILKYWQPGCDQNNNHNCVSGYLIDGNLPALCGRNPTIPGCNKTHYNTSVYNSGGSIPTDSRNASFIVWNFDVLNNIKSLTLQEKENWLHTTLANANALYKYSKKSFFNEAEYTLIDGDWENRFWEADVYENLQEIKFQHDPNYTFGCRHCVTPRQ